MLEEKSAKGQEMDWRGQDYTSCIMLNLSDREKQFLFHLLQCA